MIYLSAKSMVYPQVLKLHLKAIPNFYLPFDRNVFGGTGTKIELVSGGNIRRNSSILIPSQARSAFSNQSQNKGHHGQVPKSALQPKRSLAFGCGKQMSGFWESHRADLKIMLVVLGIKRVLMAIDIEFSFYFFALHANAGVVRNNYFWFCK